MNKKKKKKKRTSISFRLAKGRTNLELHPDVYALREGVAQTMSMIKSKLSNNQRSFCLAHPMAPSQIPTPIRIKPNDHGSSLQPSKERSRVSLSSNGDLSISADDLSFTSQLISEFRLFDLIFSLSSSLNFR